MHKSILSDYSVLLWDFDGVILDSMPIRELGFKEVLRDFPEHLVENLLTFHRNNGGLSRYVKFRYFYQEILNQPLSETKLDELAGQFSEVMKQKLTDPSLLIKDALRYIEQHSEEREMHIVSGSDQNELRHLSGVLKIDHHFKSINGSPTPKKQLVKALISNRVERFALIGDSINDYEAASDNSIAFFGYNNPDLKALGESYIHSFQALENNDFSE